VSTPNARPLAGYRFLIIEDEMMQAWRIGDIIADYGGRIEKIAFNYEQGDDALTRESVDCAIVDINLNGRLAFPLGNALEQQGIPLVYCSAFAEAFDLYPELKRCFSVGKPVIAEKLKDAVLLALSTRKRSVP
jgi:DNA-binding NtrC family response regulator